MPTVKKEKGGGEKEGKESGHGELSAYRGATSPATTMMGATRKTASEQRASWSARKKAATTTRCGAAARDAQDRDSV